MKRSIWLTLLCILFLPHLNAGVVFHIESRDPEETPPAVTEGTISIEGDRMRLALDPESTLIFDGTQRRMFVIAEQEKTYVEIDRESIEVLAAKLNPMMEQLQKQMEQLPPEQREMMEKMMGKQMGGESVQPPSLQIRETSNARKVGPFDCLRYDVFSEGQQIREMWVTEWDNIVGAQQARHVFEDMADFFRETFQALSMPGFEMPENPFEELDKIKGFPVLTLELQDGKTVLETLLQSAEEATLEAELFQPPAGFSKQTMNLH